MTMKTGEPMLANTNNRSLPLPIYLAAGVLALGCGSVGGRAIGNGGAGGRGTGGEAGGAGGSGSVTDGAVDSGGAGGLAVTVTDAGRDTNASIAPGKPCATNAECTTGVCNNSLCIHGASCLAVLNAGLSTGDGAYWINPQAVVPFQAYCDMTTDGGGWTRVAGINATDHNHVTSAAVNPSGMTTATALGKFSDVVINGLKSGDEPGFRLMCQQTGATLVTGYFSTTCPFSASPGPDAMGTCTGASYVYEQPEVYGGQFTQSCVVGLADGTHGTSERLIYGANASLCNNATTGCNTQFAHWSGNGSLWVR